MPFCFINEPALNLKGERKANVCKDGAKENGKLFQLDNKFSNFTPLQDEKPFFLETGFSLLSSFYSVGWIRERSYIRST